MMPDPSVHARGGGGGGGGAGARGQNLVFLHTHFFYAPNFEKVGSILVSACAFVHSFVRLSGQNRIQARVLKFHIWIPHQKIAYPYFFSCLNYLPLPSYAPFKS